jgi:L-threonylcarbamoyladenylate synthase
MGQDGVVQPATVLSTDPQHAAELLAGGGLIAMPTETVYGLGADAADPVAVSRIYAVKGRPADHPLIVHLRGVEDLAEWAGSVPEYAHRLAVDLWPGPLTLILPRSSLAGDHVTGGQETVGLRVPAHPMARRLLETFGAGVAAPSANRFGRVSPTRVDHVVAELGDVLVPGRDLILDGGDAEVGIESTIVDCTGTAPLVLRPGVVTAEEITRIGGVPVADRAPSVRVPGMLVQHYAPRAKVIVVEAGDLATGRGTAAGPDLAAEGDIAEVRSGFLALAKHHAPPGAIRLATPGTPADYARVLYSALRRADALELDQVLALPPEPFGIGLAIRDRLRRAASA